MGPLQQHGIALARAGCWRLLDALELAERAYHDGDVIGLVHATGGRALLAYCESGRNEADDGCDDCCGSGEDCDGDPCSVCDGEGWVWAQDYYPSDASRWSDLNGEPVEAPGAIRGDVWLNVEDARAAVKESTRLVKWLHARAAA